MAQTVGLSEVQFQAFLGMLEKYNTAPEASDVPVNAQYYTLDIGGATVTIDTVARTLTAG